MNKYLLVYHSQPEAMAKFATMSDDEKKAVMDAWMSWKEAKGDMIVDFGAPVGAQHVVTVSGSKEERDDVGGYGIIQAESLDAAIASLSDHPMIAGGGEENSISVYEMKAM